MEQTKGLSAQIPASLHARVTAERVAASQSLSEYMTELLTNYFENGGKNNMAKTRTLAFQIDENLFQRIKEHLSREYERTGTKLTQRDFVIGLIEAALERAEQEAVDSTESCTGIDTEGPMSGPAVEAETPSVDTRLFSLSAILIPDAPEKYFLSSEMTEKLLFNSSADHKAIVSTTSAE